jgi:DNA-binding transcriptional MerR regulator
VSGRSYLSIGDVLTLLRQEFPDVTISKIRFLESQGLVNPERTPSGYRKFYEHDVERLRWVLRQQREHFLPLKVIKDRLDDGTNGSPPPQRSSVRSGVRPGNEDASDAPETAPPPVAEPVLVGQSAAVGASVVAGAHAPVQEESPASPSSPLRGPPLPATTGATSNPGPPTAGRASSGNGDDRAAGRRGPGSPASEPGHAEETASPQLPVGESARRPPDHQGESSTPAVTPAATPEPEADPGAESSEAQPDSRPAGRTPPPPASPQRAAAPPVRPATTSSARSVAATGSGSSVESHITLEELATASGLDLDVVAQLREYGLLSATSVGGTEYFDDEALAVATLAAGFARFGVEPRHLRLYKNAADREAGFVEQIVLPLVRQRNPEARSRAVATSEELIGLGQGLRSALLRNALRELFGS